MKKHLLIFIGFLIITSEFPFYAQKLISNSKITGVCFAGNKVTRIYIPPPDEFYNKSGTKSGASINIIYSGFTNQTKVPLEFAASILEKILPADVKLTIKANWKVISTAGVLGNSSTTAYIRGSEIDALHPLTYYPVALAEKIAGKSLNDSLQGDIELNINSSINWYLDTIGNTPSFKYDLVTVVLHEICHGLGFFDSMYTDGNYGSYGIISDPPVADTLPIIYDLFVENSEGKRITDETKFRNVSGILNTEFTLGPLFFNGPMLTNHTSGLRAMLYVPSTFSAGSSISHLDESTTLKPNTLMTPFIDKGEAIHDPGKLTMSILGDLGWINTRIIHNKPIDTERNLKEVLLSIKIKSDTLYNQNKVGVVYSFNNFTTSNTRLLTSANSDEYNTVIDLPFYNSELQYYFFVEDYFQRLFLSPSLYQKNRYKVFIGSDIVKPVISHTPEKYYLETIDSIGFKAIATDNLGIDSAYVEYKLNNGPSKYIRLKSGKSGSYSNILVPGKGLLKNVDSLTYRIFAVDSARVPNTSVLPKTGYFAIKIEKIKSTIQSYASNFTGPDNDFFNVGFSISKPVGFSKYGLHTRHPYESPDSNNDSIEYTAMLRYPIKLNESGLLINFREIVLVEPGEAGSIFGTEDFYDYVVVEGSKNFGKTWFTLADGYDSRLFSSWESAYNNSVVDQNSLVAGIESMFQKHTIFYNPTGNISVSDTLMIRFRLFSDPYAHGWGWVIEDLKISPLIDAVEKVYYDPVSIYPNPGTGHIKISRDRSENGINKPLRYCVFNSSGICLVENYTSGYSETLVDISGFPSGIYLILLYRDDGILTFRYNLLK